MQGRLGEARRTHQNLVINDCGAVSSVRRRGISPPFP
jgi:hypothetical protein